MRRWTQKVTRWILGLVFHFIYIFCLPRAPDKSHVWELFAPPPMSFYLITCSSTWWNRKTTKWPTREQLRDIERNDKDASKPVARHFYFPKHSQQHMTVCGLSLTTSAFHSINLLLCHLSYYNLFLFSRLTDSVAPFSAYKHTHNPRLLQSLWRRANARNVSF